MNVKLYDFLRCNYCEEIFIKDSINNYEKSMVPSSMVLLALGIT